jgi:hypothetical protein
MKNDRETKNADAVKKGQAGNLLPYEKPRFESVKLFADEVLGGGCNKQPSNATCELTSVANS